MSFIVCPACQEQIDVTERKPGEKVYCAGCGKDLIVERQATLMGVADAQEAIGRARGKAKKHPLTTIRCPNCETDLQLRQQDAAAGSIFRCVECGQKIRMEEKPGTSHSDSVAFPTLAPEGTLLDMGDLREVWRKMPKGDGR
ncbi:MAG: hypothetical protein HYY16_07080 [Planctomycetes bacterium]|nr:hypothetical protein [Planctomycetota bacterium]